MADESSRLKLLLHLATRFARSADMPKRDTRRASHSNLAHPVLLCEQQASHSFIRSNPFARRIPSLVSSQATIHLLSIIHGWEKSSELVEKAIALLERIVSSSEAALRMTAATGGALQALVETMEDGNPQCKEHAVGILQLICQTCREEYRGMMLREGVMPGLLQLSVDGTRRSRSLARTLLLNLRDSSGSGSSRQQLEKNEILEQMMARIDSEEDGYNGTTLRMVEQMIAKLSA